MKVRLAAAAVAALAAPLLLPATQAFADTTTSSWTPTTCCVLGGVMPGSWNSHDTSATAENDDSDSVNAPGEFPAAYHDETQTLEGEQDIFIQGGDDLGRGAGEVVSAAYIGGPQGILDIPAHVFGFPKPLAYLNEG